MELSRSCNQERPRSRTGEAFGSLLHIVWFLTAGVVFLCMAAPFKDHYRLKLEVSTDSDWTTISFEDTRRACFLLEIVEDSGAENLHIYIDQDIHISKAPYDASYVQITVEVGIFDLGSRDLEITIEKGDIGATTVDVYNWNEDVPRFVDQLRNSDNIPGDPSNRRCYTISNYAITQPRPFSQPIAADKLVLAFYYAWYAPPWFYPTPDEPVLGYYNSHDQDVLQQHVQWAQQHGVDGFIVSWWRRDDFSDQSLELLMSIAEKTGFKVSIYYEGYEDHVETPDDVVADLIYILGKYGAYSNFLKVEGRPVIFFYSEGINKFSEEEWAYILSTVRSQGYAFFAVGHELAWATGAVPAGFDGVHIYSPVTMEPAVAREYYERIGFRALHRKKLFCSTVAPGYDDTLIRDPGFIRERDNGRYYVDIWAAAAEAPAYWILVTSFNEWFEATEIEPSVEYGDDYLEITREKALWWKGVLSTASLFRIERETGNVFTDGAFYSKGFNSGSADVAEWVPVSEPVEPGDVLELDPTWPGVYRKARVPCSTLVAGVVSTQPGVVLGHSEDTRGKALLALIGIVPVKVTDEGGPIRPGDLLVASSTPGYAMRWDPGSREPCGLLGKALEPCEESSGVILVLLMR